MELALVKHLPMSQLHTLANPCGQLRSTGVHSSLKTMNTQNNDVDVNTLIKVYNQKISTLTNQNILLEAKLTTVMTDFNDEKTQLAAKALEWQEKYENLAAEVEAE
mgnify:CR=1 FL=1